MQNVVEINNLVKQYGSQLVINNINMTIKRGEIYGLIGNNGAGKTTLMKLMLSMIQPSSGAVKILDGEFGNNSSQYSRVGVMLETPAFFPYLSAEQNLEYYRRVKKIRNRDCVKKILQIIHLDDTGNKKYKNFSLGMKQRLGIGLALLGEPDLLILDEPINGLDPEGIKEIRDVLISQNKQRGVTILISSHILSELSQLAMKFGFIHKGKLFEEITSTDLNAKCLSGYLVTVDNALKAEKIIRRELREYKIRIVDNEHVNIYGKDINSNKLNLCLVKNGVSVEELKKQTASLEDYFINKIKEIEKIC